MTEDKDKSVSSEDNESVIDYGNISLNEDGSEYLGHISLDEQGNEVPIAVYPADNIDLALESVIKEIIIHDQSIAYDIEIDLDDLVSSVNEVLLLIRTEKSLLLLEETIRRIRLLIQRLSRSNRDSRVKAKQLLSDLSQVEDKIFEYKAQVKSIRRDIPDQEMPSQEEIVAIAKIQALLLEKTLLNSQQDFITPQSLDEQHHRQENKVTTQSCVVASLMNIFRSQGFDTEELSEEEFVRKYNIDESVFNLDGTNLTKLLPVLSGAIRQRIIDKADIYLVPSMLHLISALLNDGGVIWIRFSGLGIGHAYAITGLKKIGDSVCFVINDPLKSRPDFVRITDDDFIRNLFSDNQYRLAVIPNSAEDLDINDKL